jgi:hypothetical protein
VREKLKLGGRFEVRHGKFLRSTTQDDIDGLSRRGQGQPNSEEIDEVVSGMKGTFFRIKVTGTSRAPKFGLDHGKKGPSS